MTPEEELAVLLDGVQFDSGEWIDIPGQYCIALLQGMGPRAPRAIASVADVMATNPDNAVKHHCVELLVNVGLAEADEALADALDLPLDDEVREALIQEADDSVRMRRHARFVAKARELERRWSNPTLRAFLDHAAAAAGPG